MNNKNLMGSVRLTMVFVALLTMAALFLASCQKPTCSNCNFSASNGSQSLGGGGGTVNNFGTFTVTSNPLTAFNLGTSQTIPVTITADTVFSGSVALTVSEPALSALDKGQAIQFSFSPSSVSLTPGSSAQSMMTVNAGTLSPDFASSQFYIVGTDTTHPAGQAYVGSMTESIQVNAHFDVYINNPAGKSPENWSIAVGSNTQFINHPGGITVCVNNLDTTTGAAHRVHSSAGTTTPGQFEHQPNDLTQSPNGTTANSTGGTYCQTVTDQNPVTNGIYCHNDEGGGQTRSLSFNVPVVTPSPTPSSNPNAKFSYINTNVIQTMCIGCHATATSSNGMVDLSSYAMVIKNVQVNSAATSPLYQAVQSGAMPLNGTPLSAALVQDIGDWINAGATNN
jgi:hypothetical protein